MLGPKLKFTVGAVWFHPHCILGKYFSAHFIAEKNEYQAYMTSW